MLDGTQLFPNTYIVESGIRLAQHYPGPVLDLSARRLSADNRRDKLTAARFTAGGCEKPSLSLPLLCTSVHQDGEGLLHQLTLRNVELLTGATAFVLSILLIYVF